MYVHVHLLFYMYVCPSAERMKLSVVKCDGGQKDETHGPEIMFRNDSITATSECYMYIVHRYLWLDICFAGGT